MRFIKDPLTVCGAIIILFFMLIWLFDTSLAPYNPHEVDIHSILMPPSKEHLLGTDELGRDVLSRLIVGTKISLQVGFVSVGMAVIIGTALGAFAGYYGGLIDIIIMRFVDLMLCFPSFFLILTVIAILEPNLLNIMIVIGITSWMGIARLVRAGFLTVKQLDFVAAAKISGATNARIMFRHILPNALPPVIVAATLGVAGAILTESALSFLGIGVQPPTPSWGNMLMAGKDSIEVAWWLSLFPGIAIFLTVLGYNLFGEGLRDKLDPRLA